MHSDIESDEDWGDGPLKSAPNPNKKYYKEKQEDQYLSVPPTRQWPLESCNNASYNYQNKVILMVPSMRHITQPIMYPHPHQLQHQADIPGLAELHHQRDQEG